MESTAIARLTTQGIRPSVLRVAIMRYLLEHRTHPTADDIWRALLPTIPSLSKTTVYNTLRLFNERHIIDTVAIDPENICYDGTIRPHAHFQCETCGKIYDIDIIQSVPDMINKNSLQSFSTTRTAIHMHGVCPGCNAGRTDSPD